MDDRTLQTPQPAPGSQNPAVQIMDGGCILLPSEVSNSYQLNHAAVTESGQTDHPPGGTSVQLVAERLAATAAGRVAGREAATVMDERG